MKKGLYGPRPSGPKPYGPQQVIIQPPKGYVPPLRNELQPLGVYDTKTGYWVGLPIEALIEALVWSEQLTPTGKIDSRKAATLTVPSGTSTGVYTTRKKIEVPEDEIWFLTQVELVTPLEVAGNFRISCWPDTAATPDDDGQAFWASNRVANGAYVAEAYLSAPMILALGDVIGGPLRLPPGSYLSLCAEVTTLTTADRDMVLTPYGWRGKRLID